MSDDTDIAVPAGPEPVAAEPRDTKPVAAEPRDTKPVAAEPAGSGGPAAAGEPRNAVDADDTGSGDSVAGQGAPTPHADGGV